MTDTTQELLPLETPLPPMDKSKGSVGFPKKFAFEVALKYEPLKVVMQRYDITTDHLRVLVKHKPFVVAVRQYEREVAESGLTFKLKAKLLSEDLIDTAYRMAKDPSMPASVRSENIKNIVRWAELEPAKSGQGDIGQGEGQQFNIQIVLT